MVHSLIGFLFRSAKVALRGENVVGLVLEVADRDVTMLGPGPQLQNE